MQVHHGFGGTGRSQASRNARRTNGRLLPSLVFYSLTVRFLPFFLLLFLVSHLHTLTFFLCSFLVLLLPSFPAVLFSVNLLSSNLLFLFSCFLIFLFFGSLDLSLSLFYVTHLLSCFLLWRLPCLLSSFISVSIFPYCCLFTLSLLLV